MAALTPVQHSKAAGVISFTSALGLISIIGESLQAQLLSLLTRCFLVKNPRPNNHITQTQLDSTDLGHLFAPLPACSRRSTDAPGQFRHRIPRPQVWATVLSLNRATLALQDTLPARLRNGARKRDFQE